MSTAPRAAGPSRGLLIGAGVGCGCLSLIVGVVVVFLVMGAVSSRPQPQPRPPQPQPVPPQPQPQPPQPQPQPPQPQPSAEGPPDLQVRLAMVRLEGDDENPRPVAETDTFNQGERVGAFGQFVAITGTQEVVFVWVRVEGQNAKPITEPKRARISQAEQGKAFLFWLKGAPPGDYGFGILRNNGGNLELVAVRKFRVQ